MPWRRVTTAIRVYPQMDGVLLSEFVGSIMRRGTPASRTGRDPFLAVRVFPLPGLLNIPTCGAQPFALSTRSADFIRKTSVSYWYAQ